jgi:hypothetical protein
METRFNEWMKQFQDARRYGPAGVRNTTIGLLTELRRTIAGDGPHCRPSGALEAFDKACKDLGVPFLEP